MSEFASNTTNKLPGDTSPDTYRVLLRGRYRINTTDYTLTGSWYTAGFTIDLGQYQFSVLPMVEAYANIGGSIFKMPYTVVNTSRVPTSTGYIVMNTGDKFSSQSTKVTFAIGNTIGLEADIYYQVMSLPAGGSLFP